MCHGRKFDQSRPKCFVVEKSGRAYALYSGAVRPVRLLLPRVRVARVCVKEGRVLSVRIYMEKGRVRSVHVCAKKGRVHSMRVFMKEGRVLSMHMCMKEGRVRSERVCNSRLIIVCTALILLFLLFLISGLKA